MRDRRRSLHVAAAVAGVALPILALAPHALAAPAAQPRISGIWLLDQHTFDHQDQLAPPFRPEVKPAVDAANKAVRQGGAVLSDEAKLCLPVGMPTMVTNEFALKFVETPGEITVISEDSPLVRTIYLNKTKHPTDQEPGWNGHSIGRWQGKTLVVDTANLNDRIPHLVRVRGVTSLTTHIVERYHLEQGGQLLVNEMTMTDPKILTGPWTLTFKYHRAPPGSELWEYVCEVNAAGWSERFAGEATSAGANPEAGKK